MHKIRVYVDTSVFGGIRDGRFAEATCVFFERVSRGDYTVLVSPVTYAELEGSPAPVQEVLRGVPGTCLEEVALGTDVQALASAYIAAGVLGEASADDALHVAAATVAGADLILSWNFRHIVNYERINKFNAVNLMNGYRALDIRSPLEIAHDD